MAASGLVPASVRVQATLLQVLSYTAACRWCRYGGAAATLTYYYLSTNLRERQHYTVCTQLPQRFLFDEMACYGTPCSGSSAQAQAAAAQPNEVHFRFEAAGWRGRRLVPTF